MTQLLRTANKQTRQLNYSVEFFERCANLFMRLDSGHMGSDMYHHHDGARIHQTAAGVADIEPMSGVLTWEEHARRGAVPRLSRRLFREHVYEVAAYIGKDLPIVEYGPGSMEDARELIGAMKSSLYVPTDLSQGMIASHAKELAATLDNCEVKPARLDFFADNNAPLLEEPALAVLLGLTVTNLPGPVLAAPPKSGLIRALRNLSRPIGQGGGYLLVSTHAEQNGKRNEALYSEEPHKKFGVNFLYRMRAELPVKGFKPEWFEYVPVWHESCGLLAHAVRASRDQNFAMGEDDEVKIAVQAGDVFHYNNSFKYEPAFFELCAEMSGLTTAETWRHDDGMTLYLFEVAPQLKLRPAVKNDDRRRVSGVFRDLVG